MHEALHESKEEEVTKPNNSISPKRRVDFTKTGKPTTHGTRTNYNRGCRCEECFEAQSTHNKEGKKRLAEEFKAGVREITHGTISSFVNYQCRCELCRAAYRAGWNRQYHNRKQGYVREYREPDVQEKARLRRVKEVEKGKREIVHGTLNAYSNYRCRCDKCKEAAALHNQEYRKRKRAEGK